VKHYELKDLVLRRSPRFELRIAELSLERGEKVAVVGPNGSGKTTLLRVLAFLDAPDSWSLFAYKGCHYEKGKMTRHELGLVKQQPYVFHGTVTENLAYPLRVRRSSASEVTRRVNAMLALMELDHLANARARELSGGEQKRLALGRVLIGRPDTLLLDEPMTHLDSRSRSVIEHVLKKAEETILLTTHDVYFAHRIADRVVNLRAGRVCTSTAVNILVGHLQGDLLVTENGSRIAVPSDGRFQAPDGLVTVMIDPRSLVVSVDPQLTETGNRLRCRISAIREQGDDVWLEVDCADRLTAVISRGTYEENGLNLHREVFVSFDREAVMPAS
jgi:tungstate transport system ATP-binding protein